MGRGTEGKRHRKRPLRNSTKERPKNEDGTYMEEKNLWQICPTPQTLDVIREMQSLWCTEGNHSNNKPQTQPHRSSLIQIPPHKT